MISCCQKLGLIRICSQILVLSFIITFNNNTLSWLWSGTIHEHSLEAATTSYTHTNRGRYSLRIDVQFGVYTANYGATGDAKILADIAQLAEDSGWNGFFIWDHILPETAQTYPVVDPWIALSAIALTTEKIRIGTTVTPVARRRPWKLARETVSIDHLSSGRFTLGVGLGYPPNAEFEYFGENPDPKIRAEKLDEGLEVSLGLWTGKPFSYQGKHFQLKELTFLPKPLQTPRIPIWIGGFWPNKPPFRRAARFEGVFPLKAGLEEPLAPEDFKEIIHYINEHRTDQGKFDVVFTGYSTGQQKDDEFINYYVEAGITWWFECLDPWRGSLKTFREIVESGPPAI